MNPESNLYNFEKWGVELNTFHRTHGQLMNDTQIIQNDGQMYIEKKQQAFSLYMKGVKLMSCKNKIHWKNVSSVLKSLRSLQTGTIQAWTGSLYLLLLSTRDLCIATTLTVLQMGRSSGLFERRDRPLPRSAVLSALVHGLFIVPSTFRAVPFTLWLVCQSNTGKVEPLYRTLVVVTANHLAV